MPLFESEEAEATFWGENRIDVRLMESAVARRRRPGFGDDHIADRSANVGTNQAIGPVPISQLPKHDQAVAQRTDGTGNAGALMSMNTPHRNAESHGFFEPGVGSTPKGGVREMRGLHAHRVTGGHQHHRCVGQFDRWIVRTGGAQKQGSTDSHRNDSAPHRDRDYKSSIGPIRPTIPGVPQPTSCSTS